MSEYNGWTNYETWNVKLWIDNEQAIQEMVQDFERVQADDSTLYQCQKDDALRDYTWELFGGEAIEELTQFPTGPFADLLNVAWSKVNWKEIREHIAEELEELEASER